MLKESGFIKGMQLSERFFHEVVKKIIEDNFQSLTYSAGLIGPGSEVLGFDTELSTDHHWGPRVMLFLKEEDFDKSETISQVLSEKLPPTFLGYSTHFGPPDAAGVQLLKEAKAGETINHRIEILTIKSFFKYYLNIDPTDDLRPSDWLTFTSQKLRTIRNAKIFYDQVGLKKVQKKLDYYPYDVWLHLLASEWSKIAEEEAFVGRCGEVADELGSKIIATRIVDSIMRLCFLMEKEYAPYSKWYGTAFSRLAIAKKLSPILHQVIAAEQWEERERQLSKAYEIIALMHNSLKITTALETKVSNYYGRPYLVIQGNDFADAIKARIRLRLAN